MKNFITILLTVSLSLNLALGGFVLWEHLSDPAQPAGPPVDETARIAEIVKMEATITALEQQRAELLHQLQTGEETTPSSGSEALDDNDKTIHNWYFTRNNEHRPPGTNEDFVSMLGSRGFYLGPTGRKTVYLTFDAGYENGFTGDILDTLKQNAVSAAFFVTGGYVNGNPDLVKRIDREGHIIGNHSMNHPTLPQLGNDQIREEIMAVHQMVRDLTGQEMTFFRPPAGQFNNRALQVTSELGYASVFWSMAYRDWEVDNQPGPEEAYRHVIDNIHNGAVILLHNVSSSNAAALDRIIRDLKAEGYRFGTLDEIQ